MRERLNNIAFLGSGSIGILEWFCDFANHYFGAISMIVFVIVGLYNLDKMITTKDYKKTSKYRKLIEWILRVIFRKKNV